jgi:hypothetical protein
VLTPQERQVLPASPVPASARSILDGCEDEGTLIAEPNDVHPPAAYGSITPRRLAAGSHRR